MTFIDLSRTKNAEMQRNDRETDIYIRYPTDNFCGDANCCRYGITVF